MIEVNICEDWIDIMKQVATKFNYLKINNGGDAVMCSDAMSVG